MKIEEMMNVDPSFEEFEVVRLSAKKRADLKSRAKASQESSPSK